MEGLIQTSLSNTTETASLTKFFCEGAHPGLFAILFSIFVPNLIFFFITFFKSNVRVKFASLIVSLSHAIGYSFFITGEICDIAKPNSEPFLFGFGLDIFIFLFTIHLTSILTHCFEGETYSFEHFFEMMFLKSISYEEFNQILKNIRNTQPYLRIRAYRKQNPICCESPYRIEEIKEINTIKDIDGGTIDYNTWEDCSIINLPTGEDIVCRMKSEVQFSESLGQKVMKQSNEYIRKVIVQCQDPGIEIVTVVPGMERKYVVNHGCSCFSTIIGKVFLWLFYFTGFGTVIESIWIMTRKFVEIRIIKRVSDGDELAHRFSHEELNAILQSNPLYLEIINDSDMRKEKECVPDVTSPLVSSPYF